jgi:CheY-like chemotaxis protein
MNESYEIYATRAESGEPATLGRLSSPVAQSTEHRPHTSDPTEEFGDQEYSARMGSRNTGNQKTVLYVDDNPRALRVLKSVLAGCGYKVVIAGNAGKASERMGRKAFDLVLLTYRLPRTISFKLAREIKRLSPGTPIILVSGHNLLAPEELTYVDACVGRRDSRQLADQDAATDRQDMRSVPLF